MEVSIPSRKAALTRIPRRALQWDGHTQGAAGTSHGFFPLPMRAQRCHSSGADRFFSLLVWSFGEGVQRLGNLVTGLSCAKSTKWFSEISFPSLYPSFFPSKPYFPPTLRCEVWISCLLITCPKSKVVGGGGTAEDVPSASLQNCSFLSSKSNTMSNGFTKLLLSLLLKNLI